MWQLTATYGKRELPFRFPGRHFAAFPLRPRDKRGGPGRRRPCPSARMRSVRTCYNKIGHVRNLPQSRGGGIDHIFKRLIIVELVIVVPRQSFSLPSLYCTVCTAIDLKRPDPVLTTDELPFRVTQKICKTHWVCMIDHLTFSDAR